jgi:hypothetical protein
LSPGICGSSHIILVSCEAVLYAFIYVEGDMMNTYTKPCL